MSPVDRNESKLILIYNAATFILSTRRTEVYLVHQEKTRCIDSNCWFERMIIFSLASVCMWSPFFCVIHRMRSGIWMYTPAFQTLVFWGPVSANLEQDVWEHFSVTVFLPWNGIFLYFQRFLVQFHNIYWREKWKKKCLFTTLKYTSRCLERAQAFNDISSILMHHDMS